MNVDQSAAVNAPRLAAEAVGTFNVITGVVVPVATVDVKSVPVVPKVKAATEVTVPTEIDPPNAVDVPLMVIALLSSALLGKLPIAVLVTTVITPLEFTANTGTSLDVPYVLAATPVTGKSVLVIALKVVGAFGPDTGPA